MVFIAFLIFFVLENISTVDTTEDQMQSLDASKNKQKSHKKETLHSKQNKDLLDTTKPSRTSILRTKSVAKKVWK